ncbi:MAG: 50S ribosomal protein L21 [Candidatus Methylacidiphilales bacterium]
MFAVIRTGSKQYRVQEGDVLDVELFDAQNGQDTTFSEVLLVADGSQVKVGQPTVEGASVSAEVLGEVKGEKVIAFKFKRRQGYHRTVGHRQRFLRVKVKKISLS